LSSTALEGFNQSVVQAFTRGAGGALTLSKYRVMTSSSSTQNSNRISFDGAENESQMATAFVRSLCEAGYSVVVFTVRWREHVEAWLARHDLARYVAEVTDKKPPAHVYVDDRAICFEGDFERTLSQIARFKAHWET
jgi:hypothetical protein